MRPSLRRLYLFAYRLLYNELAWGYDAVSWLVSLGQWDRWRRTALGYVHGDRVLEVGFGTGALLPLLAVKVPRTVGLEASAAMHLRAARRFDPEKGLSVPRLQGIAQRLPFADESFDTIVSTFPAAFILDPAAHREFARVLRPGGRLVVVDVQLASSNPLLRLLFHLVFPPVKGAAKRYEQAAKAAQLRTRVDTVGAGPVRVTVVISEKEWNADDAD